MKTPWAAPIQPAVPFSLDRLLPIGLLLGCHVFMTFNRWDSAVYSAPQLKGMQEVITWCSRDSRPGIRRTTEWHWTGFALAVVTWLIFLD